jgi:hypothetical protein
LAAAEILVVSGATVKCPGCVDGACTCRAEQLGLFDGLDDEDHVAAVELEVRLDPFEDAERVAAAGDQVAARPDEGARPERAQVVAVAVDEEKGRHAWTVRGATFDVMCHGGEADGAYSSGHALTGSPPQQISIAVGGDTGPALLDLPDDTVELGEHVVVYELDSIGHICGRPGGCRSVAGYTPPAGELAHRRRQRPRSPEDVA